MQHLKKYVAAALWGFSCLTSIQNGVLSKEREKASIIPLNRAASDKAFICQKGKWKAFELDLFSFILFSPCLSCAICSCFQRYTGDWKMTTDFRCQANLPADGWRLQIPEASMSLPDGPHGACAGFGENVCLWKHNAGKAVTPDSRCYFS